MRGDDDEWSPTPRVQFPSFSIPLDSRAIYILARGQQANGKITVVPQTDINDTITVDIAAEYREWDTFKGTTVCLLERKLGERGIGIFVGASLPDTNHVLTSNKKDTKTRRLEELEDGRRNHSQYSPPTGHTTPRTCRV